MNKLITKIILVWGGAIMLIFGFVLYVIYQFQNPDMTTLRLFLSNPWPTCLCILGWFMTSIGTWIR